MKIELIHQDPTDVACDALVVGVVEGGESQSPWAVKINQAMDGVIARQIENGSVRGRLGEVVPIDTAGAIAARQVLLVGLGAAAGFDVERLRRAVGYALRWSGERGCKSVATLLHCGFEERSTAENVQAVAEAGTMAAFTTPAFGIKAKEEAGRIRVERVALVETRRVRQALEKAITRGAEIGTAANRARHMAELPGNVLTPARIGDAARELLAGLAVKVTVHDEAWMERMGMGAVLGVGRGSREPSKFIVLEYKPGRPRRHVVIVGKGVSFDTGGISLKPREGMERMKYDMSGAAAVIATMSAAGRLGARDQVTGLVPTVENMPGGAAIKPGDVLITASGKSVEVTNTDAEGRLILADALDYGRRLDPDAMIDLATLTGACKIALGGTACGLMGNDPKLNAALREAGRQSGELAWELPLRPEHQEALKSDVADLKNSGGRGGGALIAAGFLEAFVGDVPWAHLDIAGVAWVESDLGYLKTGAAGFGVRLLSAFLGL